MYFTNRLINRTVNYMTTATATATAARDPLSTTFAALADPTRRAILARLVEGEAAVTELAEPFDMTLPAVSKHLKVLERAGLIQRSRHAQWRPCRLAPEPLKEVASWVEQYRRLWEDRLDRLDDYLNELQGRPAIDDQPTDD
jgi:DNA-binding transcriptional ArsR family regulator